MLMITVWTTLEGNNEHNGLRFYYYFFLTSREGDYDKDN